jgi:RNA polymerase sigma-70 factor, ECF subfamily
LAPRSARCERKRSPAGKTLLLPRSRAQICLYVRLRSKHLSVPYTPLSDEDLVCACAASKDSVLWQEFIERFGKVISVAVYRVVRDRAATPDLLEDLIQETYKKLYDPLRNPLSRFVPRHPGSARCFLRAVTMHLVSDHLRADRRDKKRVTAKLDIESEEGLSKSPLSPGAAATIERRVLLEEVDLALTTSMAPTARRDRRIFWAHYREGMSAREIAALPSIELTVKGVEASLFRITKFVRTKLADSFNSGGKRQVTDCKRKGDDAAEGY